MTEIHTELNFTEAFYLVAYLIPFHFMSDFTSQTYLNRTELLYNQQVQLALWT
jgi:hypothetical protein